MENEFKNYLSKKTNEELIEIFYFEKQKFKEEALKSVKEIIDERRIKESEIKQIKKQLRNKKAKEKRALKNQDQNSGCIGFLFEILIGG